VCKIEGKTPLSELELNLGEYKVLETLACNNHHVWLILPFGIGSNLFKLVRIYGLKREGGGENCLREGFENFSRFNKILCVNPEQKSS